MTGVRSPRAQLLLSDYAGHAFTYELATELTRRGIDISYAYCSSVQTPKGNFRGDCPAIAVSAGAGFEKYKPWRRLVSEARYGLNSMRVVWRLRPRTHVVCNMPIVTLLFLWAAGLLTRTRLVIWFQDSQAGIAAGILGQGWAPRALAGLEGFMLRRADRVLAISDELESEALRHRVRRDRLRRMDNWAPIESIPELPKENDWARTHGLDATTTLLYAGTLARKHRPELLADLARRVGELGATVVVVSEGEGADHLRNISTTHPNLVVLPYQPFDRVPQMFAAADALVVLLSQSAARFSVPSKTLAYLCAGRPILASMPRDNSAAVLISEGSGAGLVVGPDDPEEFFAQARTLVIDPQLRHRLGRNGRSYAEANFPAEIVVRRFLGTVG